MGDTIVCDVCRVEHDRYPPPNSLVVTKSDNTENVIPYICVECQKKVSDFIESIRA